jgi:hypothetical protein
VQLWLGVWAAAGGEPFVADLMRSSLRAESSEELREPAGPVFGRLGELRIPTVIMVGDRDTSALIASITTRPSVTRPRWCARS